jgi:hypothetical protein
MGDNDFPLSLGAEFLRSYISSQNPYGGSPGRPLTEKELDRLNPKDTSPPPPGFFDELRRQMGSTGVKQASSPSFDLTTPINSPIIDRELGDYRRTQNATPVNSQQILENLRRLRESINPIRGV